MSVLVTWSHIFPGWSSLKALVILLDWHWSVYFVGTTMCWQKGIRYAITYSPNHSYTYREVEKYSSSNGYLSLLHNITFPMPIWCQNWFVLKFESIFLIEEAWCWPWCNHIYDERGTSNHSYTSEGGWKILKQEWMSVLMTECHISQADLMLKLLISLGIWVFIW